MKRILGGATVVALIIALAGAIIIGVEIHRLQTYGLPPGTTLTLPSFNGN